MIRTDRNNKNYVWVDYVDIIHAIGYATHEKNEEMVTILNEKFVDMDVEIDTETKKNMVKLSKKDKVYKYLKKCPFITNHDTYITQSILKDALIRSYYEFNHEQKKKLSKYFRQFVDNEIKGIDNKILIEEILNDKETIEYIKKYDNFDNYIEEKINKNLKLENNVIILDKNKEKIKNMDRYVA